MPKFLERLRMFPKRHVIQHQSASPSARPDPETFRQAEPKPGDFPNALGVFPRCFAHLVYLLGGHVPPEWSAAVAHIDPITGSNSNAYDFAVEALTRALVLSWGVTTRETTAASGSLFITNAEIQTLLPGPALKYHHPFKVLEIVAKASISRGRNGFAQPGDLADVVREHVEQTESEIRKVALTGDEYLTEIAVMERAREIRRNQLGVVLNAIDPLFNLMRAHGELVLLRTPYKDEFGFDEVHHAYVLPRFLKPDSSDEPTPPAASTEPTASS